MNPMIAAFCTYFSILLGIGLYFYRKAKNASDFSFANRSFNYWITAIAAQASDMSDWIFMAFPGAIFAIGLCEIWIAISLSAFMFLTWQFIAPKLRKQTELYESYTLTSFFEKKFNNKTGMLKIISGFFCLYFFTFYIAAGIVGFAKAFEIIFGLSYQQGAVAGFVLSLAYTLLGGLIAVTWSNLFQGLFLLGCIIFVPFYAIKAELLSVHSFIEKISRLDQQYLTLWPTGGFFATLLAVLKWGPGYFGQPHILINFMTINNPNHINRAKWIGLSWQFLVLSAATLVGIVGKIIFEQYSNTPELIFIIMVKTLFTPFIAGLILCSVLAATVSTINIQSLICATLITQDLLKPIFNFSVKKELIITRCALFIIPLISLYLAINPVYYNSPQAVMNLVLFAWSGLAVTFGPIVILSLYSKKEIKSSAIICGLLAGGITAIFWPIDHIVPTMVIGYLINLITIFAISKL